MEFDSSQTVILLMFCLLTFDDLIANSSKSLKFIIYESCTVVLELQENCTFVVTFRGCMQRPVIMSTPEGLTAENVLHKTPDQDTSGFNQATNFGSNDGLEILAHMCACNTTLVDLAQIKAEFYANWMKSLTLDVNQSEKLCMLELVDLFKVSNYLCLIQQKRAPGDIICRLPTNLNRPNCLRTLTRLRPCNRYATNTTQGRVCVCARQHNVASSAIMSNISLSGQISAVQKNISLSEQSSTYHTNILLREKRFDDRTKVSLPEKMSTVKTISASPKPPFVTSPQKTATDVTSHQLSATEKDSNATGSSEYLCKDGLPGKNCSRVVNRISSEHTPCQPGYFGLSCLERCHCKNNAMCNRFSGACPDSCEIGWKGPTCSRRRCTQGFYGVDLKSIGVCRRKCMCGLVTDCDVLTGECIESLCLNSSLGNVCAEQICPRRRLNRPRCTTQCHCYNDMVCNPATGRCPGNLCKSGFNPPFCISLKTSKLAGTDIGIVSTQLIVGILKVAVLIHLRVLPVIL